MIISLFGIANTLALSIFERTRELGMLRAIGMSRRQVRRLIRYESVITALIGAVLGLITGMVFAALMSVPLADEGFSLSYPIAQLVLLMVLAALAGVLAAIGPARRAARLDVLEALAYESERPPALLQRDVCCFDESIQPGANQPMQPGLTRQVQVAVMSADSHGQQ